MKRPEKARGQHFTADPHMQAERIINSINEKIKPLFSLGELFPHVFAMLERGLKDE